MESPDSWDRLTASLAVVGYDDPAATWGFLTYAGVIDHNRAGGYARLVAAIAAEVALGVITGPSHSARIADRLADLRTVEAAQPDPNATQARRELAAWRSRQ